MRGALGADAIVEVDDPAPGERAGRNPPCRWDAGEGLRQDVQYTLHTWQFVPIANDSENRGI